MKTKLFAFLFCLAFSAQAFASLTERLALVNEKILEVKKNINSGALLKAHCEFESCTTSCQTCSSCESIA